ncbi:PTS sugar transporter [Enterococcus sp. JM4C]|uniref:PTS lactose/cellobiose transporter subunit IIA n=1 Tax=Candidatus Enterococcus huntleyi TaxID=1857217 RepID=UPI001379F79F|nr:PTS lactose/cellobiose transporter subunit IIA [Enterococcus sp. JM4C]KAF1298851.1 PTS sugar transporter [Enterococcus sp. JM4C]
MEETEIVCFQLISNAGAARSCYFEALQKFRNGEETAGQELFAQGQEHYREAHQVHGQLVQKEAGGDTVWMSLLMTHAEDLMMSAETTGELAKELMAVYGEIHGLKSEFASLKEQLLQVESD